MKKLLILGLLSYLLIGCSSPPDPVSPSFSRYRSVPVNPNIPVVVDSDELIPSSATQGKFEFLMTYSARQPMRVHKEDIGFGYALAHAKRITILTNEEETFFAAKQWLEDCGTKAPITFVQQDEQPDTATIVLTNK